VILGAGIAGLTAAYRRRSEGETVVLEGSDQVGGSIRTIREDGYTIELGPNTLRTNAVADRLLTDLGLDEDTVTAYWMAPRYIVRGGRARAIVPGPKGLITSAITVPAKLRVLMEPFISKRPDSLEDESVHDFFNRRFGPDLARYAAGPIVSGVYADDPKTLLTRSAFPALWDAEARGGSVIMGFFKAPKQDPKPPRTRTLNFRRGLVQMAETLRDQLTVRKGVTVLTGKAVLAIEGPFHHGARWKVRTANGETFEADTILSTIEAPAIARLLGDRLPKSGRILAEMKSSALSVVVTAFPGTSPKDAPNGFGALIPRGEGFQSLGILYPSSLFTGRCPDGTVLTTAFLGGSVEPELASAPEQQLVKIAEGESRRLHPRLGKKERHWFYRWPAAIPRIPLHHHLTKQLLDDDLAELNRSAGEASAIILTGPYRDGVALGERIKKGEQIGEGL
jgi:oxygen-dependent protoporphyrinogen oxidase